MRSKKLCQHCGSRIRTAAYVPYCSAVCRKLGPEWERVLAELGKRKVSA